MLKRARADRTAPQSHHLVTGFNRHALIEAHDLCMGHAGAGMRIRASPVSSINPASCAGGQWLRSAISQSSKNARETVESGEV